MCSLIRVSFYINEVEQLETHKSCHVCHVDSQCYNIGKLWHNNYFYICPTLYH